MARTSITGRQRRVPKAAGTSGQELPLRSLPAPALISNNRFRIAIRTPSTGELSFSPLHDCFAKAVKLSGSQNNRFCGIH